MANSCRGCDFFCFVGSRSDAVTNVLEDLEVLPDDEVWNIRIFASMRRIVHEHRTSGTSFFTSLQDDVGGPQHAIISMLDAPALVALGMTSRCWRMSEHWFEHWYLLGVKEFGTQRRLVPPGKFERFDEAVFAADMDWHLRYGNFVMAARLSIETFHNAVLSIVFSLDLETSGVEEVRQRLSEELQLGSNFLSIECVEQLLEDATTMRSLGARQEYVPDDVAGEM